MAYEKDLPGLLGTQETPSHTQQCCSRKADQRSFSPTPDVACNASSSVTGFCHTPTLYKSVGLHPHIQMQLMFPSLLLYLGTLTRFPWDMVLFVQPVITAFLLR